MQMKYIQTYEEVNIFGLFDSAGKSKLNAILDEINLSSWTRKDVGNSVLLTKKTYKNKDIQSIQIKLEVIKDVLYLGVKIKPKSPRTKLCKELFKILQARTLQFEFEDDIFRVSYDLGNDYIFNITKRIEIEEETIIDDLTFYLEHDFEELYSHMIKEYSSNEDAAKQNRKEMNDFFSSKEKFLKYFDKLVKLADSHKVETSDFYKLTNNINLLDPKIMIRFDFKESNILKKSKRHLILTDKLFKAFSLLDKGMRKIQSAYSSVNFDVYLKDRALFLNVRSSDDKTLKMLQDNKNSFYKYLLDLEDFAQNSITTELKQWSDKEDKSVFGGYSVQFNFQTLIATTEETTRLVEPLLICKGLINNGIMNAMRAAVDLIIKSDPNQNVNYKLSLTDRCLIVSISLNVKSTWQDTTRNAHDEEEGIFEN